MMRNNKKVVVFCSDNITSLGLVRCLGEAGYRPECYCYGHVRFILSSRYVSKGKRFGSAEEVLCFLLNQYPCYEERPILLTIPDPPALLVDNHKDELSRKFILSSAGKQGMISYWMSKINISNLAKKHGFQVPWGRVLKKDEPIPDDIEYPVFTKDILSFDGGKCNERICNNHEELEEVKSGITADSFIAMQYVRKVREINYLGLAITGKVYMDFHDIRDRFPSGGYGHYNSFIKYEHDDFHNRIVRLIKETKYEGLFDVEFIIDKDGNHYFMEVNFRVDGEVYKLCEGINLPAEWCRLCTLPIEKLPDELKTKKEYFIGITELSDFKASVLSGQVGLFKWLWQFMTADRRMLVNMKDPLPAFVKIIEMIISRIA